MEISMEILHKSKNRNAIWSSYTMLGYTPKESKSTYNRDPCTPMFIVALFTIAKYGISLGAINGWEDKDNVVYVHNRVLLSHKQEWNYVLYRKWMEMEIIMLSEISQTHKDKYLMFFSSHVESAWIKEQRKEAIKEEKGDQKEKEGDKTVLWWWLWSMYACMKNHNEMNYFVQYVSTKMLNNKSTEKLVICTEILFLIAKKWKWSKCSSKEEWKGNFPHNRKLFSNRKGKEKIIDAHNIVEPQEHYFDWNKSRFKRPHVVCPFTWSFRIGKISEIRPVIGCRGCW
jgi:hypothetical protein